METDVQLAERNLFYTNMLRWLTPAIYMAWFTYITTYLPNIALKGLASAAGLTTKNSRFMKLKSKGCNLSGLIWYVSEIKTIL